MKRILPPDELPSLYVSSRNVEYILGKLTLSGVHVGKEQVINDISRFLAEHIDRRHICGETVDWTYKQVVIRAPQMDSISSDFQKDFVKGGRVERAIVQKWFLDHGVNCTRDLQKAIQETARRCGFGWCKTGRTGKAQGSKQVWNGFSLAATVSSSVVCQDAGAGSVVTSGVRCTAASGAVISLTS